MNTPRGRPFDEDRHQEQRGKLLKAAAELLKEKSYRSVTVREVAERAALNSAMVRYYFKNKEGLFVALFEEISQRQFGHIQNVLESEDPIRAFISAMLQMATRNREMVRFIHDEVLAEDSKLKEAFFQGVPRRIAKFLPELIKTQINQGRMRSDLDPKWAAFSLVGMIMLPIVIAPIRQGVWDISDEQIDKPQWAEHIYQLFMTGCRQEKA
ncbi:TetR/AcrR family transcriptional regulator [Aliikangiella sp. G2MR2-5]|uniref:TetR/AcrR family transcriptional regulator n=1 Tax=Aliikangiella sp. G2MR2-5 TaxID=2788943 RepID=UPI0018AC5E40|nr:TetR/AcrR family transcriptional regulator [Aliikangiella sp. G2MR2-5]